MSEEIQVVLHARWLNGRVWADDSFVRALHAEGITVAALLSEPEPPATASFHGDSFIEHLVEHIHVYLPWIKVGAAGAGMWLLGKVGDDAWDLLKARIKKTFVRSSIEQIRVRREFEHQRTLTIYGPDGRPVSEVTVTGHGDNQPHIVDKDL